MRISLPREIIRKIQRAVVEFDLLEPGDKVLVGLSGGKDSALLLQALALLQKYLPFAIELGALTIDLGFKPVEEMDLSGIEQMCRELDIPFSSVRAELSQDILNNPQQNPCARCSYFRRAVIHNYAKDHGYNKVAFAHHYDDAVETFLMGILYSGQVSTFTPKTFLDKTGVTVIRPLVYVREKDIKKAVSKLGLYLMPNPCPRDGLTKRTVVKSLLRELKKDNPMVFEHLAAAMRGGRHTQLWPAEMKIEEIRKKSHHFWYGGTSVL